MLRVTLILIASITSGMAVQLATLLIGMLVFPLPGDVSIFEPFSIPAAQHLFETKHLFLGFFAYMFANFTAFAVAFRLNGKSSVVYFIVLTTILGLLWSLLWQG